MDGRGGQVIYGYRGKSIDDSPPLDEVVDACESHSLEQ